MTVPAHRVHTAAQALQFIRALRGEPIFDRKNVHLLSSRAFKEFLAGETDRTLAALASYARHFSRTESFVIEICSLRDFYATIDGKEFLVNTPTPRDLLRHAQHVDESIQAGTIVPARAIDITRRDEAPYQMREIMSEIRDALEGRPVLWVGHINVTDPDPRFDKVRRQRGQLNALIKEMAAELRDSFFDPSSYVEQIGRQVALRKEGEDLAHYTPETIPGVAVKILQHIR